MDAVAASAVSCMELVRALPGIPAEEIPVVFSWSCSAHCLNKRTECIAPCSDCKRGRRGAWGDGVKPGLEWGRKRVFYLCINVSFFFMKEKSKSLLKCFY